MPSKKGCTYSRSKSGQCRSMVAHYAHSYPKKKKGCTHGRHPKSKKCMSKKAVDSKVRAMRKKIAKRKISKALSMKK